MVEERYIVQEIKVWKMEEDPISSILKCETTNDMWMKLKSITNNYNKDSLIEYKF